jgi:hypothetical protein
MMDEMNESGRRALRMLAGFVIAPPTAVLIALATYEALWYAGFLPHGAPIDSLDAAASLGIAVGILAVVVTVLGAVPAVLWLIGRRPPSLATLLVLGAVLGNVPFALIVAGIVARQLASGTRLADIGQYWYGPSGALVRITNGLISGMGSAAAFWFVSLWGAISPRATDSD